MGIVKEEKYANEEVDCIRGYGGYRLGYENPKSIMDQCDILRQTFPGLGLADEKIVECELPEHAEGYFAIPKWQAIAPTYPEAVQKVLDAVKMSRNGFYNNLYGKIVDSRLRQSAKTEEMFKRLADEQKDHDIYVVAAQFGLYHRGRSVRRVREIMQENEFGLGAFAVGIMILTHPERLSSYGNLFIDCAGDEYARPDDDVFWFVPFFQLSGDILEFGMRSCRSDGTFSGSVSAFVSPSL